MSCPATTACGFLPERIERETLADRGFLASPSNEHMIVWPVGLFAVFLPDHPEETTEWNAIGPSDPVEVSEKQPPLARGCWRFPTPCQSHEQLPVPATRKRVDNRFQACCARRE